MDQQKEGGKESSGSGIDTPIPHVKSSGISSCSGLQRSLVKLVTFLTVAQLQCVLDLIHIILLDFSCCLGLL